jgi:hypothetical protein
MGYRRGDTIEGRSSQDIDRVAALRFVRLRACDLCNTPIRDIYDADGHLYMMENGHCPKVAADSTSTADSRAFIDQGF